MVVVYKRQEGFRYAFDEPLEAEFIILIDGKPLSFERRREACKILDISPKGMKILTPVDLSEHMHKVLQLEIHFILDIQEIKGVGEIVWTKPFGANFQHGLTFYKQPQLEERIVEELKIRRRKEITTNKNKVEKKFKEI